MAVTTLVLALAASSQLLTGCDAFATPPAPAGGAPGANDAMSSSPQSGWAGDNRMMRTSCVTSSGRCQDTSLRMGIRSFIKRKILRKDGGEEEAQGDGDADAMTLHSLLQSPDSAGLMESPVTPDDPTAGGEDDTPGKKRKSKAAKEYVEEVIAKDVEVSRYEDTQDRIKRMKGGGMTEEEKMAFLNTALTGPPIKTKPRGPPIRQSIPGAADDEGGAREKGEKAPVDDATAKENLWNAITRKADATDKEQGGGGSSPEISVADLMKDGKMKNEDAKRRYLESVTNPDRFAAFTTSQQPGPSPAASVAEEEDDNEGITAETEEAAVGEEEAEADSTGDDFAQMKKQIAEDRELLNPKEKQEQSAAREAVESILSMISANNDKKAAGANETENVASSANETKATSTDHLAARLGAAAEEQEKRDAEARAAAAAKRAAEKEAWAEAQKQREEELRRKEVERMEKARMIAENRKREEEEREAAIKAELAERQAKQDDYWAKKLEKENARKARSEPVELKRRKEVMARDQEERAERNVAKDIQREKIRDEERAREDPHEGEILKEAADQRLRDREKARDIEEYTAARLSRTVPRKSKEDASVSAFVREQQKKKQEIDRMRKLDEESLRQLNSPLPSPGKMKRAVGVQPKIQRAVGVQPQIPTPPPRIPPPPAPVPAPAQTSSPDISLASLTMAKGKEDSGAPSTAPPAPAPTQPLNLFEMTKLKESDAPSNPAPKKKPAKRVVRQQVPISAIDDDDDEEDDEDLMRSGAPGLTVADALKQQRKSGGGDSSAGGKKNLDADAKAKQWGIDMSKFS
ncbi:hypothetical protein ACHAXT_003110 [Thalassiosira profunda]